MISRVGITSSCLGRDIKDNIYQDGHLEGLSRYSTLAYPTTAYPKPNKAWHNLPLCQRWFGTIQYQPIGQQAFSRGKFHATLGTCRILSSWQSIITLFLRISCILGFLQQSHIALFDGYHYPCPPRDDPAAGLEQTKPLWSSIQPWQTQWSAPFVAGRPKRASIKCCFTWKRCTLKENRPFLLLLIKTAPPLLQIVMALPTRAMTTIQDTSSARLKGVENFFFLARWNIT